MVPPTDIADAGRFAVLSDPQGAVFCVYRAAGDDQGSHDGERQVGEFSWHELATTDNEAAFAFYSDLLGWQATEVMDMGEMGSYHMYHRGVGPPAFTVTRWNRRPLLAGGSPGFLLFEPGEIRPAQSVLLL